MPARAILLLSCLLCTRVLAQSPAPTPTASTAVPADASASKATGAAHASPLPSGATSGSATSGSAVGTADTTSSGIGTAPDASAIREAVPVDREALLPASPPAPKVDIESDPLFTPAVVLIGTGSAALLASLFTGLGAHGIYTSLEEDCKNNICSSDKAHRINSGKALALVSTVLTGAGIAAAGVGATLLVLAAGHEDRPPQADLGVAKVQLAGGPTPLGIGATGSF